MQPFLLTDAEMALIVSVRALPEGQREVISDLIEELAHPAQNEVPVVIPFPR